MTETTASKYKRHVLYALGLSLLCGLAAYAGKTYFARSSMGAFKCYPGTAEEFIKSLAHIKAEQLHTPAPASRTTLVNFLLHLPASLAADNLYVSIYSYRLGKLVYRGAFADKLTIQVNDDLFQASGKDNFRFDVFNEKKNTVCVCEQHEENFVFWQANANVHIDFLSSAEMTDYGKYLFFKVRIEPATKINKLLLIS
jgi:hypothetical protein